jgi:hypothetical protein
LAFAKSFDGASENIGGYSFESRSILLKQLYDSLKQVNDGLKIRILNQNLGNSSCAEKHQTLMGQRENLEGA